mgnify:FL=1
MKFTHPTFLGLALGLFCTSVSVHASSLDNFIRNRMELFDITPYQTQPLEQTDEFQSKMRLGRMLFMDTNLSGNRNISCMVCHHPMKGTSDGLPLSQTVDGKGVLKRNSPGLYNVGDKFSTFMFWDGRVHFHPTKKVFTTPEPALNGPAPQAAEIAKAMTSALAAQAIFPLVSHEEMSGKKGENEIADAKTNLEAWDLIIKRITQETNGAGYINLFNRAFPGQPKMNIGHVGEAIATFERYQFQSNTSGFHRYVAGDNSAMTEQEKRGFVVFMDRGRCIACHQGNLLGLNTFFASVGVPSYGAKPFEMDIGRGEINNERFRAFFFKTPSLINVALTAPYFHNGAFSTIREVLNHYNNIEKSLNTYTITDERRKLFPVEVEVRNSQRDLSELFASIEAGFLRNGLGLSSAELDDLEAFLTGALTDPKWDPRGPKSKK